MTNEWKSIEVSDAIEDCSPNAVAIDVGGSSIKACALRVDPGLIQMIPKTGLVRHLEGRRFSEVKRGLFEAVSELLNHYPNIQSFGISTTGSVDNFGQVVSAGHFEDYKNVSWKAILEELLGRELDVAVLNDGRASCWAEFRANANRVESHIHAVVGTGVGGGVVINGKLLAGDSGQAGYIGHMKIVSGETALCSCGAMGCVETLASAPAIVRAYNTLACEPGALISGFDDVYNLARRGNELAVKALWNSGRSLGIGLGSAMNVINPSVVTVGGGVVQASYELLVEGGADSYMDGLRHGISMAAHKRVYAAAEVRRAKFGNDSGMYGAALMVCQDAKEPTA